MTSNYLGIDLESWAHSPRGALSRLSSEERRIVDDGAVVGQTRACLELIRRAEMRVTFFITSEIFEWYPQVIEEIAEAGHEVAFHTHVHRVLRSLNDLERALDAARPFLNRWQPKGFRAPSLCMLPHGYRMLREAGFIYSSSVYGGIDRPFWADGVLELPVSTQPLRDHEQAAQTIPQSMTLGLWLREIPFGSAYFLALFGWRGVDAIMASRERRGLASNIFFHTWQLCFHSWAAFGHQFAEAVFNPLHLPYARLLQSDLRHLFKRHPFGPLESHPCMSQTPRGIPSSMLMPSGESVAIVNTVKP